MCELPQPAPSQSRRNEMISRRAFLARLAKGAAYLLLPLSVLKALARPKPARVAPIGDPKVRWGFLVDTTKCTGCGLCVQACKLENEVPFDANVSRTWIERYLVTKDGKFHADSPKAGRDGYTIVLVDRKHCIGCGYCIMACPYGARFFHPVYKTAEKCTFCYHRISKGLKPA